MSLEKIYNAILSGNAPAAAENVNLALADGVTADAILKQACLPAMSDVGRLFEIGEKFVPEMLIAARAMQAAVNILKPLLVAEGVETIGTILIGTVQGDLHDIGKNLVGMMMEGAGFEIIDLGTNVSPDAFVKAVQEKQPHIVGMSALLTTTMPAMSKTIEALKAAGGREQVKVMVGGAPISQEFANQIGADAFAADAGSAARVAKSLLGLAA
jgi:5-methyltetrahydrofolate--homocysteine methyltransferase